MKLRRKMRYWFVSLIMVFILNQLSAQKTLSDQEIVEGISLEMQVHPDIPWDKIKARVNDGIVTLSGTVTNLLAKDEAEEVALAVRGTKGLIDLIKVNPPYVLDNILQWNVTQGLLYNYATSAYTVDPKVDNGIVTLTGTVKSWQEKDLCGEVVKGIRGVRQVENNIQVVYNPHRKDIELENEIQTAIENDVMLYQNRIEVEVENKTAFLSGTVGTYAAKEKAEQYAWTIGIRDVNTDDLHVDGWMRNSTFKLPDSILRTDIDIEKAIEKTFAFDPRVDQSRIELDVNHRIVILEGEVHSKGALRAALDDARNVVGVAFVNNHLKVVPVEIPRNETLETIVEAALARDALLEKVQIEVNVWNGHVFLNGLVRSRRQKQHIDEVVSDLSGVVELTNNLLALEEVSQAVSIPYNQ